MKSKGMVLFVCIENVGKSKMAEVFGKSYGKGNIKALVPTQNRDEGWKLFQVANSGPLDTMNNLLYDNILIYERSEKCMSLFPKYSGRCLIQFV